MARTQPETICPICKQHRSHAEMIPGGSIREAIVDEITKAHPDWSPRDPICKEDLDRFRMQFVQDCLRTDKGDLTELEHEVVRAMRQQETLSKNVNTEFDSKLSFGERVADKVAAFGGSWNFIISFGVILLLWVTLNSVVLLRRPFDPYPFILLNLVLSSLAAFQAPIIMMSQNRQESKDRLRAEHDYQVNLKAELEVRTLSEKMDHLLHQQWQRLLEIQQVQTDLMQELAEKARNGGDGASAKRP